MRNEINTAFRIYKNTCITVSSGILVITALRIRNNAESLSRPHCLFMINTCSVFFRRILDTAESVFVVYTRYFQAVRFGAESLSRSQHVFVLQTHMNGLTRNHNLSRRCVSIKKRIGVESLSRTQKDSSCVFMSILLTFSCDLCHLTLSSQWYEKR